MTTSRLREIPFLHKEIDYLDIDIAKLDEAPESTEAVQQLRELLLARRERCITALATAEAFLESIPDEMTWLIFMLRFSEGAFMGRSCPYVNRRGAREINRRKCTKKMLPLFGEIGARR